jgi:hypothetical protein
MSILVIDVGRTNVKVLATDKQDMSRSSRGQLWRRLPRVCSTLRPGRT